MKRRTLLLALVGLSACAASAPAGPAATPAAGSTPQARVLAISDAYVDEALAREPGFTTLLRLPGSRYDGWADESLPEIARVEALEDRWLAELRSIDRATLGDTPAALAYDVTRDMIEARVQQRVCREELWGPVRPQHNLLPTMASAAEAQPVGTPDLRAQALRRFAKFPAAIDTTIANLREGIRLGYVQAAVNVTQIVEQADRFAQTPPTASPLYDPARRDADPDFGKALASLIDTKINPGLRAYRDFLANEYAPHARQDIAVAANPDGAACYAASLRFMTTLPLTPKDVHESGLAELARVEGEMKALSAKSFGGADIATLRTRFTTAPEYREKDAQAILAQATSAIARAKAAVPKVFGLLPTSDVGVEPIPAFQERTSAAHYLFAAVDGSRPGTYRVRLYKPEEQSTVSGESVAFHETIPGHHLQLSVATSLRDNPRITRFLFNSGFVEGWALYAERVADELGLYSDDASRFGMLASAAFRASRLVVDSGIHAFGWDRDRAIAFLMDHTTMPRSQAAQEVDRYISWPGQATAYMTGYLTIRDLRTKAERELGPRFNLKAFHDRVLSAGSVPLPVLRARVESWIASQK